MGELPRGSVGIRRCAVLIGDVLDAEGHAVAEKLGKAAHFVHLDVAEPEQWDQAVDTAVNRFGGSTRW